MRITGLHAHASAVVLTAGLFAAGVPLTGAAVAAPTTIAFVPSLASDPFFISMQYGAEQEAKKLGVHLVWQGPMGVYSPSAQLPFVNAVLNQNPTAFVLVPTDANALMPSVNRALAMHMPVVTADTTVADTSVLTARVTGDNIGGGALAADLLDKALGGSGEVYVMNGLPGTTTDQLRMQGFEQRVKTYPGLHYLGYQFSQDQPAHAAQVVRDLLLRYPNLQGIFCIDDETAIGVIQGLHNIGKLGQVKVIAYDAEPSEVKALRAGDLIGLIAQQPVSEGEMAVEMAYDAAMGHPPATKAHIIPDVLITRDNMSNETQYFYRTTP